MWSFTQSADMCHEAQIPIPQGKIVGNIRDAVYAAEKIGFPVVLKVISQSIIHKTDAKVVVADVRTAEEVAKACELILKNAHAHKAKIDGILVQKFVSGDVHMIVGAKRDPVFGPVVLVGAGGVFAEVEADTSVRVCPLTRVDVESMLSELRVKKILDGFRGLTFDKEGLIDVILKVSHVMLVNADIKELDLNPLVVSSGSVSAVDVRVLS